LLICNGILLSIGSELMFTSVCVFIGKIVDSSFGGTFITLMATLVNLGGSAPRFFVLSAVDIL